MEWFKRHADTVMVLGGTLAAVVWMNAQFSDMNRQFNGQFSDMNRQFNGQFMDMNNRMNSEFSDIKKDIAIIKTVLIMKGIMPTELATAKETS